MTYQEIFEALEETDLPVTYEAWSSPDAIPALPYIVFTYPQNNDLYADNTNYAEIVQTGDNDYEVHYKGGDLTRGEHNFKWNKEKKIFEYSFKDSLKSNSMSIVSEAILKFLLFDMPIRETIEKCNDIFRFQIISHLGSTYEKCVQESPDGDIERQRNNRIYASNVPRGTIIKVNPDGRRDS